MKWWHWTLIFLGGAFLLRNKEPATAAAHPDSGSPIGPSLNAYLDAIQQWHVDNISSSGTFTAIFDAARGYIVVGYTPVAEEGKVSVQTTASEEPWSHWFTKLFDPATCEKSANGCRYRI